jgi:hypothetical protein
MSLLPSIFVSEINQYELGVNVEIYSDWEVLK